MSVSMQIKVYEVEDATHQKHLMLATKEQDGDQISASSGPLWTGLRTFTVPFGQETVVIAIERVAQPAQEVK